MTGPPIAKYRLAEEEEEEEDLFVFIDTVEGDPEMCIVCIYSFDKGNVGPRFVENFGHNFGHKSSVSNCWRTPLLCCQAARHFLAIPVEHYCDDYATPDFRLGAATDSGAAASLAALHSMLSLISLQHQSTPFLASFATCPRSAGTAPLRP